MVNDNAASALPEVTDSTALRILNAIRDEHASSRADLARLLNLAPSTVSQKVAELLDEGLLEEHGQATTRAGRPPRILKAPDWRTCYAAVDLGTSHARYGYTDINGRFLTIVERDIDTAKGPSYAVDEILACIRADLAQSEVPLRLAGLCLSVPAPVDPENGWVEQGANLPRWSRFPLRTTLETDLGIPVMIVNDANALAVGEHSQHPHLRHSIAVKIGRGIGTGIVIDSLPYNGATGSSGDISHTRVAKTEGALPCACGNTGCLETLASAQALLRQYQEHGGEAQTIAEYVRLAQESDPLATTLARQAGRRLGKTLASVVSFFNPDAVFLGGLISTIEPFVAAVRSSLYDRCHPLVTRNLIIEQAGLGPDAGITGGAYLIRRHVEKLATSR